MVTWHGLVFETFSNRQCIPTIFSCKIHWKNYINIRITWLENAISVINFKVLKKVENLTLTTPENTKTLNDALNSYLQFPILDNFYSIKFSMFFINSFLYNSLEFKYTYFSSNLCLDKTTTNKIFFKIYIFN